MWTQIDSTGKVLGMWVLRDGQWVKTSSDVTIPDSAFDEVNQRIDQAIKDVTDLSKTVTSIDGKTTVSGKEPTAQDAKGRPEGAMWTQIDSTGKVLGMWVLRDGTWVRTMPEIPDSIFDEVNQRIDQAEQDVTDLSKTVTSIDGKTTVSGNAPTTEDAKGRPEGAMWVRLGSDGQPLGRWYLHDGQWVEEKAGMTDLPSWVRTDIDQALASAKSAQTTADGKNRVFVQAGEPAHTGLAKGDLWRRLDTAGNIIGEYAWNGAAFAAHAITADSVLLPGSVTGSTLIKPGSITVGTVHIGDGEILTELLKARKISTSDISADGIDAGVIKSGYINAARIQAGSLDASQVLVKGSVGSVLIADGAITARNISIGDGEILTELLKARKITSTDISTAGLDAGVIKSGYINAARIQAGSLDASKVLVKGSVNSVLIADGTITAKNISIGNGEILTELLKARKITSTDISTAGLDAGVITTGYLSAARIKAGSLDATQVLVPGSVDGGVLIKDGTITAKNIRIGNGEILTELLKARKIVADDITAGTFNGYVFSGSVYQSSNWGTSGTTSWQLNDQRLEWWHDGVKTIYLDGTGKENLLTGTFQTASRGNRVVISPEFKQASISADNQYTGSGISMPLAGDSFQAPYIASEATSTKEGDISTLFLNGGLRDSGAVGAGHGYGAFARLGMRRDDQKRQRAVAIITATADYDRKNTDDTSQREWYTTMQMYVPDGADTQYTISAHSPSAEAWHWANVSQEKAGFNVKNSSSGFWGNCYVSLPEHEAWLTINDANGQVGVGANIEKGYLYLGGFLGGIGGGRNTFQWASWKLTDSLGAGAFSHVTWSLTPAAYGFYHAMAQPVCGYSEVSAHPEEDANASTIKITAWNAAGSASPIVWINGFAWLCK
ncbi:hypothetical protein EM849_02405 [Bifidobacterium tissieri]|nr:hypothetical protein EM849_02405 [Bifidobacterium tissieri]